MYFPRIAVLCCVIGSLSGAAALAREPEAPKTAPDSATAEIAPTVLKRHVEYLASPKLEGRGTPRGKQLALDYIRGRFEELHLAPLFGDSGFIQDIPGPVGKDGAKTVLGRNIGAWLPGSDPELRDEYIILSAHYDHLGIDKEGRIYTGADDNAGSVAMMLEVARRLAGDPQRPRRSVVFLSCDLEERMLWGSRWFVAHPPWPIKQVKLFITAEMIGRTLGNLPMKTIFVLGAERGSGLRDVVNGVPVPAELQVAHLGIDVVGTRSDYGPFQGEKVPFLFFSGGEHPDYHTPRDTADRVDYARVANVSKLIEGVCRWAAATDEAPQWIDRPTHELDEIRTLHGITDLLLKLDDAGGDSDRPKLTQVQRFTVTNMHQKTAQILERGTVLPADRPGIVRNAQLLLLTVF
ncbi:MAG: M20/M25/M40 family metallo-hydrolase [Planctomycetia bacterium]|nr:M20/M25/M40 family metallo-hydrolase [Planctomycetia bacterium]